MSKSLLSVQSKNVSEVAADEIENIPINNLHHVLENQPPDEVRFKKKLVKDLIKPNIFCFLDIALSFKNLKSCFKMFFK